MIEVFNFQKIHFVHFFFPFVDFAFGVIFKNSFSKVNKDVLLCFLLEVL